VQSRIKALERMTVVEEVVDEGEWTFAFPEPEVPLSSILRNEERTALTYISQQSIMQ
jgi:hypothetical protein